MNISDDSEIFKCYVDSKQTDFINEPTFFVRTS